MSNITEIAQEMVVYLRGLASGKVLPRCSETGLCNNFAARFDADIACVVRFEDFPEYSGDDGYPIKSPNNRITPHTYYMKSDNLWIGRYGNARKRFCLWCADQIENDYL